MRAALYLGVHEAVPVVHDGQALVVRRLWTQRQVHPDPDVTQLGPVKSNYTTTKSHKIIMLNPTTQQPKVIRSYVNPTTQQPKVIRSYVKSNYTTTNSHKIICKIQLHNNQ